MAILVFVGVENIAGKWENAGNQHFLTMFSKTFPLRVINKRAMMALYRSTGWYLGICLKHKTPKKD